MNTLNVAPWVVGLAERLFATGLDPAQLPTADEIHQAVEKVDPDTARDHLAFEYGKHPQAAAARMTWALGEAAHAYTPDPQAS